MSLGRQLVCLPQAWALMLWMVAAQAQAQVAPDTGRLLHDTEPLRLPVPAVRPRLQTPDWATASPAPASDPGWRLTLRGFRFTRNTAFSADRLAAEVQRFVGREVGMSDLQEAADRITALYRSQGYLLASAHLPAQAIADQVVEITVLEGVLGAVTLDNRSKVSDKVLQARTAALPVGTPLRADTLKRSLLLINSLAGADVQSTLTPGASMGTADLDIRVNSRNGTGASVGLDNHGNRFTGVWRAGAQLGLDNLLHVGDTLAVRLSSAGALFGHGRISLQLPVNGNGLQAGVAGSTMNYRLGKDFAALRTHGTADIGSAYLLYPLRVGELANIQVQANLDRKWLTDQSDSTGTSSRKRISVLMLGLAGDQQDGFFGGGSLAWSLGLALGRLRADSADGAATGPDRSSQGSYQKLSAALSRQQGLGPRLPGWQLALQLSAQVSRRTSTNGVNAGGLDSSEKFSLGGLQGVRAYPQGEVSSDDGWTGQVELRHSVTPAWQVTGFVDVGQGWLDHSPVNAAGNRRRLSGVGLGASHVGAGGLGVSATLAWRTAAIPTADRDRAPRIWTSLSQAF